ncbi:hypothetical protein [Guyparkeria sp.]|uniref:hypothetical protein n=1 Tax=Guyparkeria sp. TaxID=2035736 RepID=UPI00397109E9
MATEEQSAVADEMNRDITSIGKQTESTTEDSLRVMNRCQQLYSMSTKFVQLIGEFVRQ